MGDSPPSPTEAWVASVVVAPSVPEVADPPRIPPGTQDPIHAEVATEKICALHGRKISVNAARPAAKEPADKDDAVDHQSGGSRAVSVAVPVVRKDTGEGAGLDGSDDNADAVVAPDVKGVGSKKPRKVPKSPLQVKKVCLCFHMRVS